MLVAARAGVLVTFLPPFGRSLRRRGEESLVPSADHGADLALRLGVGRRVRFDLVQTVGHPEVGGGAVSSGRSFLVSFVLRSLLAARRLVPRGRGVAVLLLVAARAELGGRLLVDAGEVGEVEQQRGGEAAETSHVEGQRLAGLQVVERRVTRRPESWEALIGRSGE